MAARILVVEDDPSSRELFSYLLRSRDHEVEVAPDGRTGVDAARTEFPDLIVMDVEMPVMNGYEAVRALKQDPRLRTIPVVAVTAFAMVGDRDQILAAGFDEYITKPIEPLDFIRRIESLLAGSSSPFAPSAHVPSGGNPAAVPPTTHATVLVVDNMAANRSAVRAALEPDGIRIIEATTAAEALLYADEVRPDLILSDIHMPDTDGHALLKSLRSAPETRDLAVAFLSSSMTSGADRARALHEGAAGYIERPVEPEVLRARVNRLLAETGGS